MRNSSKARAIAGLLLVVLLVAGAALVAAADRKPALTVHDKAYYADANLVDYVQPGLVISVVSAKIASDGTISVDYKLADPNGAALDSAGIVTPGAISVSFLAAYIPPGQAQYASYITHSVTAANSSATATQPTADSGGTTTTVNQGEYIYTFKAKAPAGFSANATTRIGIYGSRNLTQWDLGTNYADTTYDFIPSGTGNPTPRDVVRTADCNACHGSAITTTSTNGLAAHGGSRRTVDLCIMCHQPQNSDPNTGNSLDMKVFIHQIHMGSSLPSVQAGAPYQIIGYQNSVNDFSTVVFPANVERCQACHNPKNGAAQTNAWMTTPSAAACGSCHNNVNFATGANHPGGAQANDTQCASCHIPQGTQSFDASIIGAHTIADQAPELGGLNFKLLQVSNGTAGNKPTVTFTVRDKTGAGIAMSNFTTGSNSLSLTMAGPTSDYGYTSFGSDVTTPGYVTESATGASCTGDGTCQYTFTHAVPAKATGTYTIGIEGRLSATLFTGTPQQTTTNYGGTNQVINFSVDGTPVAPRRTIITMANCNACHSYLEVHGDLRNNVQYCVLCHNPSETDSSTRPSATVVSQRSLPNQGVNFTMMIHKIHSGVNLAADGASYTIIGHGGSVNDFAYAFTSVPAPITNTGVRFPAMGPSGAVYDTAECYMCHSGGSEAVLPVGKNPVTDPQGPINPAPTTTSACTACHVLASDYAHAKANTSAQFGEACTVCHATGAAYDATQVHAGQ
ncbi:MAG: OmcA/MtrC family decaheme c-type cytochrome [Bryobacteraceae bacterium]